ncbi:transcriptional regulator, LysR family [Tistlia consotensis]|uniref:Transcriptional regulator, LysR family n=1 Tax=Tistlia consotensis USBA 355 TaxID=560819 RepID=A0A1Y6BN69_9PROT|nr:LysR family transcriptional regulator [Tistlia consotensis]SMF16480.1 transcriptional regulator, LysR family [Tistlia consotensis USBA 355]SNR41124.1 transcriptional regulator, LysR family [Tistlia consotensis]
MQRAGLFELNAVVAVAARRSFRAAAAELGMSPSALSHAVAALERRLGVRLFNRTTRSVALSEAGEQFLARVGPALREIAEAMEAVEHYRDRPAGTLRINASEGAARQILEPVVLPFLERYPEMSVDLVTEGRLVDIVAEGFDAGIRIAEAVPRDMIAVPCGPPQRFVVVAAPGYLARRGRPETPGDLVGHACIRGRLPSGAPLRWEFARHGEPLAVEVSGPLTLGGSDLIVEAALNGAGLAYVSEWAAARELAAGRLVRLLDDWAPAFPGLSLYYPGHRLVPAGLKAFVALVREATARWDAADS